MKKVFTAFPIVVLLSLLLSAMPALAATPDGAGNVFLDNEESGSNIVCSSDLYWFGFTLDMQNTQVAGEAFLAGETVDVSNCQIAGSIRGAGNTLYIANTTVGNNITVAGNTVRIGTNTVARGVYAAGNNLQFDGMATYLNMSGSHVVLNGTVNGDANIYADTVTIGENAVITGQLAITADTEPSIPATAKIGSQSFTESSSDDAGDGIDAATAATVTTASAFSHIMGKMLYRIGTYLLVALFFCWILQKTLRSSVEMVQKRPAPMIVAGLVALIAMPIALIVLCITVIGIPLATVFSLLMVVVTLLAMPFTGVAVGQRVFSKMNRWLSGLIGAAIIAVLSIIPFLGLLIRFCCMAYVLGYFLQVIYGNIKGAKQPSAPLPPMPGGGMPMQGIPGATPQTPTAGFGSAAPAVAPMPGAAPTQAPGTAPVPQPPAPSPANSPRT